VVRLTGGEGKGSWAFLESFIQLDFFRKKKKK